MNLYRCFKKNNLIVISIFFGSFALATNFMQKDKEKMNYLKKAESQVEIADKKIVELITIKERDLEGKNKSVKKRIHWLQEKVDDARSEIETLRQAEDASTWFDHQVKLNGILAQIETIKANTQAE